MTPYTTALTYENIPLVVSGKRDAEDCWVEKVCVAGTVHDISEHLDSGVVERIAELADAQVAREAAEQRADAAWARFQQQREEAYNRCPA